MCQWIQLLNTTCERRIIFWYQLQILMQLDLLSHLTNSSLCCALNVLQNMNKDSKIQLYRHLLNTYKRIYWVSYIGFLKSETLFLVKSWTIFQFSEETVMHFFLLSLYTSNLSLSHPSHTHIYKYYLKKLLCALHKLHNHLKYTLPLF